MTSSQFIPSRKAALKLGVHPNTLRNWEEKNLIETIKTPTGQRLYNTDSYIGQFIKTENKLRKDIVYARVSSASQKEDLETQKQLLRLKFPNHDVISDIGSGLNYKRKGLKTILDACLQGNVGQVVVTYKDRLCRFGFDMFEYIITKSGGTILVLNDIKSSPQEEMVTDLTSIIHVFSCRLYGLRRYKKEIKESFENNKLDVQNTELP